MEQKTLYCAYCKGRIFRADRKCPSCGSTSFTDDGADERAEAAQVYVPQAAPYVPQAATPYDGAAEVVIIRQPESSRNRWIALLLCLFGGIFGLHRFYAGKIFTGIVYLLTGGLFGFGAVVDFINILFGNFRDNKGLRLSTFSRKD